MRQYGRERTANDSNSSKAHRLEGYFEGVPIKPAIFITVPLHTYLVFLLLLNTCPRQAHLTPPEAHSEV
jgi:hypothetical protein